VSVEVGRQGGGGSVVVGFACLSMLWSGGRSFLVADVRWVGWCAAFGKQ
jgi:hypothetical protein